MAAKRVSEVSAMCRGAAFNRFYTRQAGLIEPKQLTPRLNARGRILQLAAARALVAGRSEPRPWDRCGQLAGRKALHRRQQTAIRTPIGGRSRLRSPQRTYRLSNSTRDRTISHDIIAQLPANRRADQVDAWGGSKDHGHRHRVATGRPAPHRRATSVADRIADGAL